MQNGVIVTVQELEEAKFVNQAQKIGGEGKQLGQAHAGKFGDLVRERRKSLKMTQDDLALATGVGRRFIIDLEAGKATCELGRSLMVAEAVGLRIFDLLRESNSDNALLPDMPDDEILPP